MEKLANNWREKLALDKKKNLNSKLINEYGLRLLCYRYFIIVEYFTSRFNLEGFCSSQIIFSMLFFFLKSILYRSSNRLFGAFKSVIVYYLNCHVFL